MNKTNLAILLSVIAAGSCFAGKELVNDKAAENKASFTHNNYVYKPQLMTENGKQFYQVNGRRTLISGTQFKIDPDKYYVTSVRIRSGLPGVTRAILGVAPVDAQNRVIGHINRVMVPKSFTKLVKPCAADDTSIMIEDGVNWVKVNTAPAFNVKADGSDIPCFSVIEGIMTKSVEEKDDGYLVTFDRKLGKAFPAGTTVRQHRYGGAYIYDVSKVLNNEWTLWQGKPRKGSTFPKGTVSGRMVLICNNGYNDKIIDFDELKIEEVDAPVK